MWRTQTMVKGHIVFEQGEPVPSTMFIIADGLVQLFKRAEGEVASALSSGQHFGAYPRQWKRSAHLTKTRAMRVSRC